MRKKVAFLINPTKRDQLNAYVNWVKSRVEMDLAIFDEKWPNSLAPYDEVWVMGGDGTFNYFVNRYPACSLPIGLFKGGTGNDFYWKLFGDISREMHLLAILEAKVESVDAGQVNEMLFLNGVGIGIEGEVLRSMEAIRYIKGGLGYYLAAIPALFRFKHYRISGLPVFLCMVFNSSRAGGGFHFFPMASIEDGELDMMVCKPLPVWKRLIYMPIIQAGKHVHLPFLNFSRIRQQTISCDRVLRAQVDGEVLASKTFEFRVLPAKFEFIVPINL
ncbi:diacylglycerol kinase family protein [Aquirufa sp. LEPPI-3A]|uniref:diacylglycerol/lipid kinase family protein n=1 Tax=Aquirufa regiilacus TaxID=3024868 RepID=UPI0028DFB724|nr:diacylglycerol kinase family protein [Aquirufa sp. LEPPI-3A]MDT8887039.1 diacylglycerol kinase family protein [Aquirufa sp. LEPPI-3A]